MRQTLLSIAIISALSLAGLASAQTAPVDIENKVNPPGDAPKAGIVSPRDVASGQATGIQSPRDSASGLPTGVKSPRDSASGLPTGKR
jgi:hypothetical protein